MFTPSLNTSTNLYHPQEFPLIETLDDILPLVADNPGIRLFKQDKIQVLRYLINSPEVFTTPADLEARGLIFDHQGRLLSRPLHKFFNIGERANAEQLATHGPGRLVTKLDGSMIGAFVLDGTLYFHTKGGVSRQAKIALDEAEKSVKDLAIDAFNQGYTPIFEWTAPNNRIVIDYTESKLRLLALRHRTTGIYNDALAQEMATEYGVEQPDVIALTNDETSLQEELKTLFAREDIEGAVYIGPNGLRAKAKTKSYLFIHKTVSQLSFERHALRAVLEEVDDDILPLLHEKQKEEWAQYAKSVRSRLLALGQIANEKAQGIAHLTGKEAAMAIQKMDPTLHPLIFAAHKGKEPVDTLLNLLKKHMGSDVKVQAVKETYTLPSWTPPEGLFLKD